MFKAKEISLVNISIFLLFSVAVSAGYFISRPHTVSSKSVPVFMGDEVLVQNSAKAITAVKAEKIVAAKPALQPQSAVPLPIVPPSITYKVLPSYPASALEKGLGGTVVLSVFVGLSGQPEKVDARTSSGVVELDNAAAQAVAQWEFAPAAQGGQAIASWFEIPVKFEVK
jgi:TonB family protein